jgi:hypothetical protein
LTPAGHCAGEAESVGESEGDGGEG